MVGACLALMYGGGWLCGSRLPPIGRAIAAIYLLEGVRATIFALAGADPVLRAGDALDGLLLFGALYILAGSGRRLRRRSSRSAPATAPV